LELLELSAERREALLNTIPGEFDNAGWRRCKAPGCSFWDNSSVGLQRHRHLLHFGVPVQELFDRFHLCGFQLPRPLGPSGLPEGPYVYCQLAFDLPKDLAKHKTEAGHRRKKVSKEANAAAAVSAPNVTAPHLEAPVAPEAAAPMATAAALPAPIAAPLPPLTVSPAAAVPLAAPATAPGAPAVPAPMATRLVLTAAPVADDVMPTRVELRYKIRGEERWYCGTVQRPSTQGERKFFIRFDNGDKETQSLPVGSRTWRVCEHLKDTCEHDWCRVDFVESAGEVEQHLSLEDDRSDSD